MDKIIQLDYDESRWNNILKDVKSWSNTIWIIDYQPF